MWHWYVVKIYILQTLSCYDSFSSSRLVVEFPATGGAIPSYQIRTVKLLRYITYWDFFILGCEVVFCLFILYYVVEEILELRIHRFSYFKSIWNILDIVVILVKKRVNVYKYFCHIKPIFRILKRSSFSAGRGCHRIQCVPYGQSGQASWQTAGATRYLRRF